MMNAPAFWYDQRSPEKRLLRRLLLPAAALSGALVKKRFDLYFPVPMEKPVICVGNLVAGGAGKTPVVMALADLLKDSGFNPHLLTRGYGGREAGPLQIAPTRDTAFDVGDEALLLVEKAPTWVSANKGLGVQSAIESGADIVVMDDGYQNAALYKDFSLLVIDGGVGFGNRSVIPAGPLREPLGFGLARADAAVVVGQDKAGVAELIRRHKDIPVFTAALEPDADNPDLSGRQVFAFAGIGRPDKFRETLEAAGAKVEGWAAFPDHYPYDDEDLAEIAAAAKAAGAPLVTTAKDWVRVPQPLREQVLKFGVHLVWQEASGLLPLLTAALQKRRR